MTDWGLSDGEESSAFEHTVASGYANTSHRTVTLSRDVVFHLHGFEHYHSVALLHSLTSGNYHFGHYARERSVHRFACTSGTFSGRSRSGFCFGCSGYGSCRCSSCCDFRQIAFREGSTEDFHIKSHAIHVELCHLVAERFDGHVVACTIDRVTICSHYGLSIGK